MKRTIMALTILGLMGLVSIDSADAASNYGYANGHRYMMGNGNYETCWDYHYDRSDVKNDTKNNNDRYYGPCCR